MDNYSGKGTLKEKQKEENSIISEDIIETDNDNNKDYKKSDGEKGDKNNNYKKEEKSIFSFIEDDNKNDNNKQEENWVGGKGNIQ